MGWAEAFFYVWLAKRYEVFQFSTDLAFSMADPDMPSLCFDTMPTDKTTNNFQ